MALRLQGEDLQMKQFWNGEQAVFKLVVRHWAGPLDAFGAQFIQDLTIREEIIADVFYALFHNRMSCQSPKDIATFLFTSLACRCQDKILETGLMQKEQMDPETSKTKEKLSSDCEIDRVQAYLVETLAGIGAT